MVIWMLRKKKKKKNYKLQSVEPDIMAYGFLFDL